MTPEERQTYTVERRNGSGGGGGGKRQPFIVLKNKIRTKHLIFKAL